jgi:hypothetical protein
VASSTASTAQSVVSSTAMLACKICMSSIRVSDNEVGGLKSCSVFCVRVVRANLCARVSAEPSPEPEICNGVVDVVAAAFLGTGFVAICVFPLVSRPVSHVLPSGHTTRPTTSSSHVFPQGVSARGFMDDKFEAMAPKT